jgi:hypothetical protein
VKERSTADWRDQLWHMYHTYYCSHQCNLFLVSVLAAAGIHPLALCCLLGSSFHDKAVDRIGNLFVSALYIVLQADRHLMRIPEFLWSSSNIFLWWMVLAHSCRNVSPLHLLYVPQANREVEFSNTTDVHSNVWYMCHILRHMYHTCTCECVVHVSYPTTLVPHMYIRMCGTSIVF